MRCHLLLAALTGLCPGARGDLSPPPAGDTPFLQETAEVFPLGTNAAAHDVRGIAVATDGVVFAATRAGVLRLDRTERRWLEVPSDIGPHPVFTVEPTPHAQVVVGAWNGLFLGDATRLERVREIHEPIAAVAIDPEGQRMVAAGPTGLWHILLRPELRAVHRALPCSGSVQGLAITGGETVWIATRLGLYRQDSDRGGYLLDTTAARSCDFRAVTAQPTPQGRTRLWAGGLGGVAGWEVETGREVEMTTEHGLPDPEIRCLAAGPDARLWIGTHLGVVRWDGVASSLRHSRRWLPDDDVLDLAFERGGDPRTGYTAWIATAGGVSKLSARPTTLAAKAAHYAAACEARHVRPPGIVEKCRLRSAGDLTSWEPQDDDNDGGYTAFYLAMESFRFAVTRNPEARDHARRAFAALRFLQTVTGTPGFVARTVIPADWKEMHDPNETLSGPEQAARRVEDPRDKYVPVRWRPSPDGRWLWKGDTSSDEIAAHLFGCYYYHELAADGPERNAVRDQVCRIVDHLIEHGYRLVDQDGRPTRWGVWAPEQLLHDPDWATEAGINAVEILSFLKLAGHLSGDQKYEEHARRLLRDHDYAALVRRAKNLNPATRTHIDDELLAFAWPALIALEKDPERSALYRAAFDQWHAAVAPDQSPFFEVLYAALTNARGAPSPVLAALRDQPLDLVRWTVDNRGRTDVRLVREPELEFIQTDRLLPPSERGVPRTDENPRRAIQGDDGHTESDGVFWLLPYWMARHYGFVAPPGDP